MSNAPAVVIGLGEIGQPIFNLIRKAHPGAVGVDVEPVDIRGGTSVMHICYPFEKVEQFVAVTRAYVEKYAPELVIIHSTVGIGTVERLQGQIPDTPCVFSPVRGKHTRMEEELQHYNKFVAGSDAAAVDRAIAHLGAAGIPTATMDKTQSLELAKLLETTYFGLLIAWAQEMDRFAESTGGDYMDAARFFEEVGYLPPRIFVPGFIGGHCVMPNIGILKGAVTSPMLEAIEDSNNRKGLEVAPEDQQQRQRVEPVKMTALS